MKRKIFDTGLRKFFLQLHMLKAKEEQIDTFGYMSIFCIARNRSKIITSKRQKNICNPFHLVRVNKQDNKNYKQQ